MKTCVLTIVFSKSDSVSYCRCVERRHSLSVTGTYVKNGCCHQRTCAPAGEYSSWVIRDTSGNQRVPEVSQITHAPVGGAVARRLLGGLPLASKTVSLTVSKMAASQLAPGVENGDFLFRGWCLLAARVCLACMHKRRVYGATRNCFNIS